MSESNLPKSRMLEFFRDAADQYKELMCSVPKGITPGDVTNILLSGIFFTLREGLQQLGFGGNTLVITPFQLEPNKPVKVLERDKLGRARNVTVWVDSGVGLPDPLIRLSTKSGSALATGVRLTPGIANPFGKVPNSTELWMASDVAIRIYVVETT